MKKLVALALGLALAGPAPASPQSIAGESAYAVDSLVAAGRLQEAAWSLRERGDTARAAALLARLDSILRSPPIRAAPLSMDSQGVSYTFRLDHGAGVHSIFKVDGSDIFCPECGAEREVAAYRIDRLLEFDLTPMTVFQEIVQAGDTLRGSAMYFVAGAATPAETGAVKPDRLRLLDAVIGNSDRHAANWLILDGRVVAIDHNRAFEYHPNSRAKTCWEVEVDSLARPDRLGEPYRRYRQLPDEALAAPLSGVIDEPMILEFLAMRDRVVERVEARVRGAEPERVDCEW